MVLDEGKTFILGAQMQGIQGMSVNVTSGAGCWEAQSLGWIFNLAQAGGDCGIHAGAGRLKSDLCWQLLPAGLAAEE